MPKLFSAKQSVSCHVQPEGPSYIVLLEVTVLAEQSTDFRHGLDAEDSFQGQVGRVIGCTTVIDRQSSVVREPAVYFGRQMPRTEH